MFQHALLETNIVNLETWIGPHYVEYEAFPPPLGKDLISEDDFANGIGLKIYVLRPMPPRFLVVKYVRATGLIVAIKMEDS